MEDTPVATLVVERIMARSRDTQHKHTQTTINTSLIVSPPPYTTVFSYLLRIYYWTIFLTFTLICEI